MIREEELDWLYRLRSEIYVYMPEEWLIPMNNALDMVIKELEQEPILDKIRAEIDGLKKDSLISWASSEMIISTILAIIDKYKAESEDE